MKTLFVASVIATGLTYRVIDEFYVRINQKLPVTEKEFYTIQRRFVPYIASYADLPLPYSVVTLCQFANSFHDSVRNSILDSACLERQQSGANVIISVDGRWSSRRQAMEGTVTCFDARTREILDVQHVGETEQRFYERGHVFAIGTPFDNPCSQLVQDRSYKVREICESEGDRRTTLYTGSAKSYESFGMECISKRLKAAGINVTSVVKDGDSNALTMLQVEFPNIRNILDKNHYLKNIPKNIDAACQGRGARAPELRGHQVQIQQQIKRILGIVHQFEEQDLDWRKGLFTHLGLQMVNHLCGEHKSCPVATPNSSSTGFTTYQQACIILNWHCHVEVDDHGQSNNLVPAGEKKQRGWKYRMIRCNKTRDWLMSFIYDQAARDEIMWYGSSNMNESFHNAITVKASKRVDFR